LAKVRLSVPAVDDLDRMIVTHSLPGDTRLRVQRSLRVLEQFPRSAATGGRWALLRVILGPWRWMLVIYSYVEPDDVVLIVAFQDARSVGCSHCIVRILLIACKQERVPRGSALCWSEQ
jgi:hypothetical protein